MEAAEDIKEIGEKGSVGNKPDVTLVSEQSTPIVNASTEENAKTWITVRTVIPADADCDVEMPCVDVVHVTTMTPDEEFIEFSTFVSAMKTRRRDLVFRVDMSSLLAGDFTESLIEEQATNLLRELMALEEHQFRRTIIFVAYDFGSLVVKKALDLATKPGQPYWSLYMSTFLVTFCGCPQRDVSSYELQSKLMVYFFENKQEEWAHLLNADSIGNLADTILNSTNSFIASKITLRTRIISLYANQEKLGKLPSVFRSYAGSLGVPSEILIPEQAGDDLKSRFPSLQQHATCQPEYCIKIDGWMNMERVLWIRSSPPRQFGVSQPSKPVSNLMSGNLTYKSWVDYVGPQILYIHGTRESRTYEVADEIFLAWRKKHRDHISSGAKAISFDFESADPLRNSIPDMVASFLVQAMGQNAIQKDQWIVIQSWFQLQVGWTERSCLNMLDTILYTSFRSRTIFLLHNFDECKSESREAFLDYFKKLSDRTEYPLKVIVTSRKHGALEKELDGWPEIDLDDSAHAKDYDGDNDLDKMIEQVIAPCSMNESKAKIRSEFERLATTRAWTREGILELLRDHTGWPAHKSLKSLTAFTELLGLVGTDDTSVTVLDKLLRSIPDQKALRWLLEWILCSYRPLTPLELAMVSLYYYPDQERRLGADLVPQPSASVARATIRELEAMLRVIVSFNWTSNQVTLRSKIRDLLIEDTATNKYIWNEARRTGHLEIIKFSFARLLAPDEQSRQASLYQAYTNSGIDPQMPSPSRDIPTFSDGTRIESYLTQALPYHLSICAKNDSIESIWPSVLDDSTANPINLWAKRYWSQSSPLSRQHKAPEFALPVLVGLGLIPYEDIHCVANASKVQCFVAAAGYGSKNTIAKYLPEEFCSRLVLHDALCASIKGGHEDTAVHIAKRLASFADPNESSYPWPQSFLRQAAWLNMENLAKTLLQNGFDKETIIFDPTTGPIMSEACSRVLYVASTMGHTSIVRALLAHYPETTLSLQDRFAAFENAAFEGRLDLVNEYANKYPSITELDSNQTLLVRVGGRGSWKALEALLRLKVDPNRANTDQLSALWIATIEGLAKTTRTLLQHGADANIAGPENQNTSLPASIVLGNSEECARELLLHHADPNHELIQPPLLHQIIDSDLEIQRIISFLNLVKGGSITVNMNATDLYGQTALMYAIFLKNLMLVQWLLRNGADVNIQAEDGRCALYMAIMEGDSAIVKELLLWKPKLDVKDKIGLTLLHVTLDGPNPELARILLENGADPELTAQGNTALYNAVYKSKQDIIKILIEKKANLNHLNASNETPIWCAVARVQDVALVRLLADAGADLSVVDESGNTLLHAAVQGPLEIVKLLLEYRTIFDANRQNNLKETPLAAMRGMGTAECVASLMKAGADMNAQDCNGYTALHKAAWTGNVALLKALLSQPGIDVNLTSQLYGSALQIACFMLQVDCVTILLDHGADEKVVLKDTQRSTALIAALIPSSVYKHSEDAVKVDQIVRLLVRRNADVKAVVPGSVFYSCIMAACFAAGVNTINFLLDEGASTFLTDSTTGRIPLHYAAANGLENFRAVLLSYGGDRVSMAADRAGKNSLHWAAQFGNTKTVELILSKLKEQSFTKAQGVDSLDSDGWTPLCWAARCTGWFYSQDMKSETADYLGTVKMLLHHGADPRVECQYGTGDNRETLTPLIIAQRHNAPTEIINMLNDGIENESNSRSRQEADRYVNEVRRYTKVNRGCDICHGLIRGLYYQCSDCFNIDFCTKCSATNEIFHSYKTKNDGKLHAIKIPANQKEYEGLPPPVLTVEKPASDVGTSGEGRAEGDGDRGAQDQDENEDLDSEEMEMEDFV